MTIPAVMFIEIAMDTLKSQDADNIAAEIKEFNSLGTGRKNEVIAQFVDPMSAGYLLGLETARALLATNIKAVQAGVTL